MNDIVTQFFYECAGVLVTVCLVGLTLIHVVRLFRLFRSTGTASPNSLNYTPRGDRIIVKRAELPEVPSTGIVVPASQTKALDEGTVVAVGESIEDLEVGDYVCFLEYAGTKVTIDGEEYLSMRDEEVHGVRNLRSNVVVKEPAGDPRGRADAHREDGYRGPRSYPELDSTLDEKEVQFFRGYMKMHPTKWDKLVDAGLWKDWHDESPARILKGSARNA